MRIVILTPRVHFHAPFVLRALEARARSGADRYLVVTTPKLASGRSPAGKRLRKILAGAGPDYLLSMAAARALEVARGGLERLLRVPAQRRTSLGVAEACRLLEAEVVEVRSVREPALEDRLRAFDLDLLCAVFFNQVVPPSLLALPRRGSLNVHPSFLPEYRGVSPCFWALALGEGWTGATIHGMTGDLDRGPILAQARLEICASDTLHSLYRRCAVRGGELLADLLADPAKLEPAAEPLVAAGSYFGAITRSGVRQFRARGRKFF